VKPSRVDWLILAGLAIFGFLVFTDALCGRACVSAPGCVALCGDAGVKSFDPIRGGSSAQCECR
jgi:hypothetical protein